LVAAGEADLGVGTDTGGSIRGPAAFCGLIGLRPTHGRIDTTGVRPMAAGFDTVGLLARNVAVIAHAFEALTATASPRLVHKMVFLADLVARADAATAERTDAVAAQWAEVLGLELGHEVLVANPVPTDLVQVFWPLMSRQLWEANGAWVINHSPTLGEGIEERIRAAGEVDDEAVATAETGRRALVNRLHLILDDAIAVLPTAIGPAPRRDTPHADLMAWRDRNLALVVPASLAGAPQLSLPAGTIGAPDDAPVGVSLLGLPGDDELLLSLAAQLTAPASCG